MEQKNKMIEDKDTNIVYLSHWLKEEHPHFFDELTTLLYNIGIDWALLPHSNDYWCRDYMPIQTEDDKFLKYWYHPSYLLDCTKDKATITNSLASCKALGIKTKNSSIIIDGGNIVPCGDKIVMTTRVFCENCYDDYDRKFTAKLEKFLEHPVIFIPWHEQPGATLENGGDIYGHADGIIKYCGDNHILMNYDGSRDAEETYIILTKNHYNVTKMSFPETIYDYLTWAYINFLQIGNNIIIPKFDIPEDEHALHQIQTAFPSCTIHKIKMKDIVEEGGALHCLTWNIKKIGYF